MTAVRVPSRAAGIAPPQFDLLNARASALRGQGHTVISLGQAVPDFGPPPPAVAALRDSLDTADTHVYSADAGHASLRQALCEWLAAVDGVRVSPDEVIVTAGGNQAFMLALMTLIDPGDEVLLPSPYFVNHEMAIAALGAEGREVAVDEASGFVVRWRDLEPAISRRTRGVVLCSPSNPTGAIVPRDEMTRIARELAARGIALFCDETYARFVYEGGFPSLLAQPAWRDCGVVVSTFSKTFGMTGWRVGYLIAPSHVCEAAIRIQDAMIICAPVPSQVGVEAALRRSPDYAAAHLAALADRRALLHRGLRDVPRLRWTPAPGGFFAFVHVEGCRDSAALAADILERAHVVTVPGSAFGRAGEGFIRLSYSAVSRDELQLGVDRLRRYFSA